MIRKTLLVIAGASVAGRPVSLKSCVLGSFEIVSADSRQVYRRLDIGTGKDKTVDQAMIDVADPGSHLFCCRLSTMALPIIEQMHARETGPVDCRWHWVLQSTPSSTKIPTTAQLLIRRSERKIKALSNDKIVHEIEKIDPNTAGHHRPPQSREASEGLRDCAPYKCAPRAATAGSRAGFDVHMYVIDLPREELYQPNRPPSR